jgi:hypothetical protein
VKSELRSRIMIRCACSPKPMIRSRACRPAGGAFPGRMQGHSEDADAPAEALYHGPALLPPGEPCLHASSRQRPRLPVVSGPAGLPRPRPAASVGDCCSAQEFTGRASQSGEPGRGSPGRWLPTCRRRTRQA